MANETMRDLWATAATGWVKNAALFDLELAGFADAILAAVEPHSGDRLLDVGCGTGVLLEEAVASGAAGVGIDIAPAMVDAARSRVPGATFVLGDAQVLELAALGPFTGVISRFGVMFFEDPATAFANMRAATTPGGRLVFVCWRGVDENPMFSLGTSVLAARLDPPAALPVDGTPGPVAFADADRIRDLLSEAGWTDVNVEPLDVEMNYATDGGDGIEERVRMITNTSTGMRVRRELEPTLGEAGWNELLDEIREELRRNLVDGEVRFNGATWLVTATA